jgi:hypothetical protein
VNSWRILLANLTLADRSGTVTASRDLALGLLAAGHRPMLYAPDLGEVAEELRAAGIPVVSELSALPEPPDVVHGNHHVETVAALLHFPAARGLFVCHDRTFHASAPPRLSRIRRYVAVDEYCLERLTGDYGIPADLTRVIYNSVDTSRFPSRSPLPVTPSRAAVFSNYASPSPYLDALRVACTRAGLPLDVIGSGVGNTCADPERILGDYDLVFAKARCALEALAVGAAVVLCDVHGVGPMVTFEALPDLRRWNFGRRLLGEPVYPATLEAQLRRYDAADAQLVSRYVREHADLAQSVGQYLQVYDEIMREPPPAPASATRELEEYLRASAGRVHELETALAHFRQPYQMEPLSHAACAQLELLVRTAPAQAAPGASFQVVVDLQNDSDRTLASFSPFPLNICYRWIDGATETPVGAEGARTSLRPALLPAARGTYTLHVTAPTEPGSYRLRVTLVQESLMWLDSLERPVKADVPLTVG